MRCSGRSLASWFTVRFHCGAAGRRLSAGRLAMRECRLSENWTGLVTRDYDVSSIEQRLHCPRLCVYPLPAKHPALSHKLSPLSLFHFAVVFIIALLSMNVE